jgi:hypothetical protein
MMASGSAFQRKGSGVVGSVFADEAVAARRDLALEV